MHTLYPASLLSFLSLLGQKSVKEALIRQIGEGMFLPRKLYIYITGEEPVYVSAEITSIKVKDKLGNERIFSVNIKLKTMFEKLYEAWTGKPYFYVYAFSPVGLSVVDGEGRRVGLYHGKIYQEIPNARYHKDKYGTQLIVIAEPEGNMKIEIEALESGSYTLFSGYIEDGTLTKYLLEVSKSVREGETNTFSVDLPRKRHEVKILALIILVTAVIISVIVIIIGLNLCLFVVHQTEYALLIQLGKPVKEVLKPGLYFKIPFIQTVSFFEKRILEYDSAPTEIVTRDKKNLVVDNYARWKITDPLKFMQAVKDENGAQSRLDDIVYSELRVELGRYNLNEIVSLHRDTIMAEVTERCNEKSQEYGISIVDVRIKRADLPEENEKAVFERMRAERLRQANQYRSEGEEEALKIRAKIINEKDSPDFSSIIG
mgnify:CR=1 FL=1